MKIHTIFTDLGGVLLTNGWDREARKRAVEYFQLDQQEFEQRHKEVVEDFEIGILTLDSYMKHVVFYQTRGFTPGEFKNFLFSCSQPIERMYLLLKKIKADHGCKIAALSNESAELARFRIQAFDLPQFIDYFIVSGFVGFSKPDERIYKMAAAISGAEPSQIVYIDDRPQLVNAAERMGWKHAILHKTEAETRALLELCMADQAV